jgi:hypothetical protein
MSCHALDDGDDHLRWFGCRNHVDAPAYRKIRKTGILKRTFVHDQSVITIVSVLLQKRKREQRRSLFKSSCCTWRAFETHFFMRPITEGFLLRCTATTE